MIDKIKALFEDDLTDDEADEIIEQLGPKPAEMPNRLDIRLPDGTAVMLISAETPVDDLEKIAVRLLAKLRPKPRNNSTHEVI